MVSTEDHRGSAGHAGGDLLLEDPPSDLKSIFDDIQSTLRVPYVDLLFRELGSQPDYLRIAWGQLKTNARTIYFERQADAIRAFAALGASGLAARTPQTPGDAADAIRVALYADPKLLVAVAALRAATTGWRPRLTDIPAEEKRQIPAGIPAGASMPPFESLESAPAEVADVFDRIKTVLGTSALGGDVRALAVWPDFLHNVWAAWEPVTGTANYRRLVRDIRMMAEEAVLALPFRMDLSPHSLRHCGLTEAQIDWARETLGRYHTYLSGAVALVAFLGNGLDGPQGASRSPFPIDA